jgi:hypothetical protein
VQMVMRYAVSTRSLGLTRNHIHLPWLAKDAAVSTATWAGKRRYEEAGGSQEGDQAFCQAFCLGHFLIRAY